MQIAPHNRLIVAGSHSGTVTLHPLPQGPTPPSVAEIVTDILTEHGTLNSTACRTHAIGSGFSGEEISRALANLQPRGLIVFDSGPRNAKLWRLVSSDAVVDDEQIGLPTLTDDAG